MRDRGHTAFQLRVKRFDGTNWVAVGGPLNADPTKNAGPPSVANVGGALYVTWDETNGTTSQVRVARDLAPSCSSAPMTVRRDTATTISLSCGGDPDGDPSTLAIVTGPSHGSVAAINQAAHTVTYTPSRGYRGPDSFSFRANDGTLDSNTVTITLSVVSRPVITRLTQSFRKWRAGNKLAHITKHRQPPIGTTFGFSLNEPAAVRFAFTQRAAGRKVAKKCLPRSKHNRKKPKCTRTVTVGTLRFSGHAGHNKVRFQGRLSRTRKLRPGRYTLTVTATTAGLRSLPRSVSFTIVKR